MRISRFVLLAVISLFIFTGAITAIALPRRSAADSLRYCLQLRTPDDRRHLIDIRSGDRAYLSTDRYKVQPVAIVPARSANGAVTAYITQLAQPISRDDATVLWFEGDAITPPTPIHLPLSVLRFNWLSDRRLFFVAAGVDQMVAGSATVQPDGQITFNLHTFNLKTVSDERLLPEMYAVTSTDAVTFWLTDQDRWTEIPLPEWTKTLPTQYQFIRDISESRLALSRSVGSNRLLVLLDPFRGTSQTLQYANTERLLKLRWSPTGHYVAALIQLDDSTLRFDVWDLSEPEPRSVTQIDLENSRDADWLWSPREDSAIFTTNDQANLVSAWQVHLADPGASDLVLQGNMQIPPYFQQGHLFFNFQRERGYDLVMLDAAGNMTTLAQNLPMIPFYSEFDGYASFHWRGDDHAHFLFIDLTTHRTIDLLANATDIPNAGFQFITVSAELFIAKANISSESGSTSRYFALNPRTFQPIALVDDGQQITYFSFNYLEKQGSFIAYWISGSQQGLHVVDQSGKRLATFILPQGASSLIFNVAPDLSRLIFMNDNALGSPYLLRLDGEVTQLPESSAVISVPAWSPDSQRIAVIVDRQVPQDDQIIILDAEGNLLSAFPARGTTSPSLWTSCR
ncbi:MAG: hypothetical protein KF726_16180 [Anaerolineae bacterium]|nr:hypothetical protein [Anaerolineae bacterium]